MSTPVNQLPNKPASAAAAPEDPEVLNVLKEMEEEVQNATRVHQQSVVVPSVQHQHVTVPQQMMQPQLIQQHAPQQNKLVDFDMLQRAGVIALVAMVAFYPNITDTLYTLSPYLEPLSKFDIVVRAVALAVLLYVAFTQFGL